jgi:PAS domain S-box-containing protein
MSNTSITDSSTALHHQEFSFLDQQKLLNIIQAMMDAVLVFTPEGIIRFYNPAFEKTFGFTRESRAGKTLDEIFQAVAPGLPQVLKQSIASPEPLK